MRISDWSSDVCSSDLLDRYWLEKHGSAAPVALDGATRYQTYLYELGESFARRGRETLYPVSDPLPTGYDVVVPPGPDVPANPSHAQDPDYDGVPSQPVASNGQIGRAHV